MNGTSSIDSSSKRLQGKVAIITGGASGFGKSTAKLFVQHGAKVVIGDVQDEQGISLCNEINASITNTNPYDNEQGVGLTEEITSYIHCDVSNENDVKNLIDHTVFKHGKLDIMFNNAGIFGDSNMSILETTSENFKKVFETNVFGGFLGAKHAARVMIPRESGVILFTLSVASTLGGETPHAYTMSKHAIAGLMKNLCVELGQYGIRVNAISPGGFSTPLATNALGLDKGTIDTCLCEANVLKGVASEPMDVAYAALFLASDESKFVSGASLGVDGGYSITNQSFAMVLKKLCA